MRRGDLVTVAPTGEFGKPRPALVIQSDLFQETATVTLLLLTSALADLPLLRVNVDPDERNRLRLSSQVQVDKAMTVMRAKVGEAFGRLNDELLVEIERRLALFLGIAK